MSAPGGGSSRPGRSLRAEIREGVGWLWRHRLLRDLALLLGLMNLWFFAGFAVLVLFAQDVLGLDEVGLGLLMTAMAAGAVTAGVLGGRLAERVGTSKVLWLGSFGSAFTLLAIAPASDPWIVALAFAATGFAGTTWNVVTVSLRQQMIPDELLGRVNSVYRFLGWGGMPVGALIGGLLAGAYGLRAPFYVGGTSLLVVSVMAAPGFTSARLRSEGL
ncbi:MAG: MFS transporter [Acidimicrobiales bacterium]